MTVPSKSESETVRRATTGDEVAISQLYERYVDVIYRYVRYRVDDDETARDITADVFVRALESLGRYDEHNVPFLAWLYRISHARVVDHWRKSSRRDEQSYDEMTERGDMPAEAEALDAVDILQHAALHTAMRRLTSEQQEVLILKYMQGLTNGEISDITGKTVGAVKALQHRGLEALARLLHEVE